MSTAHRFEVEFSVKEKGRRRPEYTLKSDLNGEVSLKDYIQFCKDVLVSVATDALKEELDKGFAKDFSTFVDRKRKPVENVLPFGRIEFVAPQASFKIFTDTYAALVERSKRVTGRYVESHQVMVNKKIVATNEAQFKTWLNSGVELKTTDKVMFVNVAPYARKLERKGITKTSGKVPTERRVKSKDKLQRSGPTIAAPNGVYYLTTKAMKRKYKNNLGIRFTFMPGSEINLSKKFAKERTPGSKSRTYLYPAIIFSFNEYGGAK